MRLFTQYSSLQQLFFSAKLSLCDSIDFIKGLSTDD